MHQSSFFPLVRLSLITSVAVTAIACSRFQHSGPKGDFALPVDQRPLEVPPPFEPARRLTATSLPSATTDMPRSALASTQKPMRTVFRVRMDPAELFDQVAHEMARLPDVKVQSQERSIGSFEVKAHSVPFIVRITSLGNGESQVSVMDARGLPAEAPAPVQLLAHLKQALSSSTVTH